MQCKSHSYFWVYKVGRHAMTMFKSCYSYRTPPTSVMTSGFLVLIREMMSNVPNHSLSLNMLENLVSSWQRSPASLLCGWVTLEPNWAKVTGHVMRFLSGLVASDVPVEPRVTFDAVRQMWRWIGEWVTFDPRPVIVINQMRTSSICSWIQIINCQYPIFNIYIKA